MSPPLLVDLLLILLFIPLAFGLTVLAKRRLPPGHPLRAMLERHGVGKTGRCLLFAVYAIGGVILAVAYT